MNNKTIGKALKRARIEKNITREQMAIDTGYSISSIRAWELGNYGIRATTFFELIDYMSFDSVEFTSSLKKLRN